jgi:hypothetical protein
MTRQYRRPESDVPERPITFKAAENIGAFELAELWSNRMAWPVRDRTVYDELAELACMAALARWLTRWLPIAIHSAMKAGAKPEAVARACGVSVDEAYERWNEWAVIQRDFIIGGTAGITTDEYEAIVRRFTQVGTPQSLGLVLRIAWIGAAIFQLPVRRRPNSYGECDKLPDRCRKFE